MDKWLGLLFIVLVIYNMIYDSTLSFKQKEDSDFEISENRKNRKGYTQKQLSELLGISDKTISKWECGVSPTKGY